MLNCCRASALARERDLKDGQKALLGLPRTPPPAQAGAAPAPADNKQGGAAPARSPQPLGPPLMQARRSAPSDAHALCARVCCRWACMKAPRQCRGRQAAPGHDLQKQRPWDPKPAFIADELAGRTAWLCDAWRRQTRAAAGWARSTPGGSSLSLHVSQRARAAWL